MVKHIKKRQLEEELRSLSKEDLKKVSVFINCELQTIDVRKQEENEFTNYILKDVSFEIVSYRYNSWKQRGLVVCNAENLLNFLSKIASSEKLLEYPCPEELRTDRPTLPEISWGDYLRPREKVIKTMEEWLIEEGWGWYKEQKQRWISLAENKYRGIHISGKLYYTLEQYRRIIDEGTKIELETKQEEINWLKEQLKQNLGSEYETKIEVNYPQKFLKY